MNMIRRSALMSLGVALCVCGCTSYRSLMEKAMREQAEAVAAAKTKPLPPLPEYPEDANAVYDTSVSLMIVGNTDVRDVFAAALQEAGYRVLGEQDKQTAAFQLPDVILYPKCQFSCVVHGDGASWRQVAIVVGIRSAVRLARNGTVEPMPSPRIFKMCARARISDDATGLYVPDSPTAYAEYRYKEQKKGEKDALKVASSRLMHIDAFRRAISKKRVP